MGLPNLTLFQRNELAKQVARAMLTDPARIKRKALARKVAVESGGYYELNAQGEWVVVK